MRVDPIRHQPGRRTEKSVSRAPRDFGAGGPPDRAAADRLYDAILHLRRGGQRVYRSGKEHMVDDKALSARELVEMAFGPIGRKKAGKVRSDKGRARGRV